MKLHHLHRWDLSPAEAIQVQKDLSDQIITDNPLDLRQIRRVAGVDVSVKRGRSQAAVVVVSYPELEVLETVRAQQPTTYPYIPGLLTFREGPVLVAALSQLQQVPDVFLFDGMGIIHPRRMGIAAHMGLWLDRPAVGCGKTHFVGEYEQPDEHKGDWRPVHDRGEVIGAVLRTRDRVKPVYVSVGHRADLPSAIALTLSCTTRYRLPEPIRFAHKAAGAF